MTTMAEQEAASAGGRRLQRKAEGSNPEAPERQRGKRAEEDADMDFSEKSSDNEEKQKELL